MDSFQQRLVLLDSYIVALRAGVCDAPQRFLWEEDTDQGAYRERGGSFERAAILKRARLAPDVRVDEWPGGFSLSLRAPG